MYVQHTATCRIINIESILRVTVLSCICKSKGVTVSSIANLPLNKSILLECPPAILYSLQSNKYTLLFVNLYVHYKLYLYGDPVRTFIWQRISKKLSIFRERSSSQCHSTIFRQFVRVKKYLCLTFQWVLDIHNTIIRNHTHTHESNIQVKWLTILQKKKYTL